MSCITPEDYIALIEQYIFPTPYEWVFILFHVTVFIVGLVGNTLVCLSVYRNHSMRTVTNYFIVNLAIADFLVILVCLPPTVLWDVTETWFLGSALCKIVLYFQGVSVSVSVLTLTFISIDRWYAICYPLKFKSTTGKARIAMLVIWTISLIIVLPDIIVLNTMKNPSLPIDTHYFTDCGYTWSEENTRIYQLCIVVLLFIAPFTLMSVAYYQIAIVLWNKNIPGSAENECSTDFSLSTKSSAVSVTSSLSYKHANRTQRQSRDTNNSCKPANVRRQKETRRNMTTNRNCEGHIRTRRKAAKMLIAVVMMFAFCYFPVHLMNILRYTVGLPQNDGTTVASLVSHWLCYANSAINPIIYNFMSGKFRREFKNTFACWRRKYRGRTRAATNIHLCRRNSNQTQCEHVNLNSFTHH